MTLPEAIPALAQDERSQVEDTLAAFDRPTHPSALQPMTNHGLASRFNDPAANGETPPAAFGVLHAALVPAEVPQGLSNDLVPRPGSDVEGALVVPKGPDHVLDSSVLELEDPSVLYEPRLCLLCPLAEESVSCVGEMLRSVVEVVDVDSVLELRVTLEVRPDAPSPVGNAGNEGALGETSKRVGKLCFKLPVENLRSFVRHLGQIDRPQTLPAFLVIIAFCWLRLLRIKRERTHLRLPSPLPADVDVRSVPADRQHRSALGCRALLLMDLLLVGILENLRQLADLRRR